MKSEGPLHFWNNLTYHRLRFDAKADLIEKVIPLEDDFYLFLDRAKNYHLVTHNSNPKLRAGRYPIPFYANCLNPNTVYSVDYLHLYKYIYGKKISRKCMEDYYYHINQKRPKYLQFVYLGNHKLAIQMNRYDPLALLDLQHPNQCPEIFDDISETELLINVGNGCIAWYERRTACVWLCCYSLHKRKRLNFTSFKIKGLYRLNNEIIITKSKSNIELLNISKNTIIRSFNSLNSSEPLHLSVHSPSNTFSYISNGHIFVYTIEKGKIKWENFYDFKDYQKPCLGYTFIGDGYIAAKIEENIYIFMLDTHNFSLITVLQHVFPPYMDSQGLNAYCCNSAIKRGSIMQIESLDSNKFIVVGSFCKRQHSLHGLQRVDLFTCDFKEISEKKSCVFSATTSGSLESIFRSNYNISTTLLFEEYRDPVTMVDSLDDQKAAFITERGRIFKVDMRLARVKEVTGLVELMSHKGVEVNETNFIDKFCLLNYDIVLISIKIGTSPYVRIVLFSISAKSVKWDSNNLRNNDLDERHSFYDVVKVDGDTVLTSYNIKINQITVYQVGKLIINNEGNKSYTFHHILSTDQNGQSIYDKLWLIKDSIIGMRHVDNVFHLTLIDYKSCQILEEFHLSKYFSINNIDIGGIIAVKYLSEGAISMHIKMKYNDIMLVYNWKTKELLNKLTTENCLISTLKQAPFNGSRRANLENVALFGFYAHTQHGIKIKSINDVIHNNNARDFEIDHNDFGMCIWPNNFSPVPNKKLSITYESDHNKNYICLVRPVQFKLECLRIMKTHLKDDYHEIILGAVLDMIFS